MRLPSLSRACSATDAITDQLPLRLPRKPDRKSVFQFAVDRYIHRAVRRHALPVEADRLVGAALKILADLCVFAVSYLVQSKLIFRRKNKNGSRESRAPVPQCRTTASVFFRKNHFTKRPQYGIMNQSKAYGGVIDCALRKRKETENNMFIKETVKGMRDILPAEMEVREYLLARLKAVYTSFGYTPIETPCMERIENLTNKQGGENEKLIFKVLKRGEKLAEAAETADPDDLCDAGMRYDLTVPLSRYYANNAGSLPAPFKALQVGSVWRADRPQKGRFRQFTQCDIDILGDSSNTAESELIYVTSLFLDSVGVRGNTVMVNDRRVLKGMAKKAGFAEEDFGKVFITLDKYDKVGEDGVRRELIESGCEPAAVDAYMAIFHGILNAPDRFSFVETAFGDVMEPGVADNLRRYLTA